MKIGFLIGIQISIIVGSFLTLSQYTIQSENLGNSINLSDSNRFLAVTLFHETAEFLNGKEVHVTPYDLISDIDTNIYLLKNGGSYENPSISFENQLMSDRTKITPAPDSTYSEFNQLEVSWEKYKNSILDQIHFGAGTDLNENLELIILKTEFVDAANQLTFAISQYSNQEKVILHDIQISLLFVNIIIHLFLLYLIIKLVTNSHKNIVDKIRTQQKNQILLKKLHQLLIQKNSIQLTSTLMLKELEDLEKLTTSREFSSEEERVSFFWDSFYQNIQTKLLDYEQSKKNYEDKIQYYEQLNKRFENSIRTLQEKNQYKTTEYDSNIFNDLRDLIDSLTESGKISPKNNRLLTNLLNNISDIELKQKVPQQK